MGAGPPTRRCLWGVGLVVGTRCGVARVAGRFSVLARLMHLGHSHTPVDQVCAGAALFVHIALLHHTLE